ncbi:hypothetical protein AM305_11810 [Actinobacillus minor NM305]|uniref:Uncharacterized protein n=1 Tax=Actinobacillus minor NM305 TaxID=637911 RepID=C5S3A8_9PAST|nr:hypothetical protein AM305_11810 [Actinobacillus minor NM305]
MFFSYGFRKTSGQIVEDFCKKGVSELRPYG